MRNSNRYAPQSSTLTATVMRRKGSTHIRRTGSTHMHAEKSAPLPRRGAGHSLGNTTTLSGKAPTHLASLLICSLLQYHSLICKTQTLFEQHMPHITPRAAPRAHTNTFCDAPDARFRPAPLHQHPWVVGAQRSITPMSHTYYSAHQPCVWFRLSCVPHVIVDPPVHAAPAQGFCEARAPQRQADRQTEKTNPHTWRQPGHSVQL